MDKEKMVVVEFSLRELYLPSYCPLPYQFFLLHDDESDEPVVVVFKEAA